MPYLHHMPKSVARIAFKTVGGATKDMQERVKKRQLRSSCQKLVQNQDPWSLVGFTCGNKVALACLRAGLSFRAALTFGCTLHRLLLLVLLRYIVGMGVTLRRIGVLGELTGRLWPTDYRAP